MACENKWKEKEKTYLMLTNSKHIPPFLNLDGISFYRLELIFFICLVSMLEAILDTYMSNLSVVFLIFNRKKMI